MNIQEGLSFDDILVIPAYSEIVPKDIETRSILAGNIMLNVPIISAAMDTVTEEELAIAMALEGGAGEIHMNLSPEEQARQVGRVKRFLNWIIDKPVTVEKTQTISEAVALMEKSKISGLPVIH
ncbi:MAG: IMP dehydrogenase, partial [Spirochaetaceae bacterium]